MHKSRSRANLRTPEVIFFFSSRRRHTRCSRDWSSDVCSSDLDGALAGEMHLREAGHSELPSPVRTGSGSKGVISARAFMNKAAGTPVVSQSNVAAAPSHLPRFGWPVTLAGLVHLLPLRAERERGDPARAVESQDDIQVVDLVLQQLRPLFL